MKMLLHIIQTTPNICTSLCILILSAVIIFIYNKNIEMEEKIVYLLKIDHMRHNEWERMMKHQSKICTKLKKEFDEKLDKIK